METTTTNTNINGENDMQFILEGLETLRIRKKTRVRGKPTVFEKNFTLKEVTAEELVQYRKTIIKRRRNEDETSKVKPYFVFKTGGKFYYTEIPRNLSFMSSTFLGKHKCSLFGQECKRFSAFPDEKGGCAKVRDEHDHIDKYSWITEGFETFGTKQDCFRVIKCEHYEKAPKKEEREKKKQLTGQMIASLEDHLK